MNLNFDKVTTGTKPIRTNGSVDRIPPHIRSMSFDEVAAAIVETRNTEGAAMIARQKAMIEKSACKPCKKNTATIRLMVWLTNHSEQTEKTQ